MNIQIAVGNHRSMPHMGTRIPLGSRVDSSTAKR